MEHIQTLDEFTKYEKHKLETNAINTFKKGSGGWKGIRTFGVISPENPDGIKISSLDNTKRMDNLKKQLKDSHYIYVKQDGKYGNEEHSLFVFNISLDMLKKYSGEYEQESFIFSEIITDMDGERKVKSSYYEKEHKKEPFNKIKNPYVLKDESTEWLDKTDANDNYSIIGKRFKYSIPFKIFEDFNTNLIDSFNNKDYFKNQTIEEAVEHSVNGVGMSAWYYRGILCSGCYIE